MRKLKSSHSNCKQITLKSYQTNKLPDPPPPIKAPNYGINTVTGGLSVHYILTN